MLINCDNPFYANPQYAPSLAQAGIDSAETLWAYKGNTVKNNVARRITAQAFLPGTGEKDIWVFIKRYSGFSFRERLKNFFSLKFRLFDALDEARSLQTIAGKGVPVPAVIAAGRRANGDTVVMIQGLDWCEDVRGLLIRLTDKTARKTLIARMAELAAQLHTANVAHQDMYPGHFYVAKEDYREMYLIDLQRAICAPKRLGERWVVKDLGQLIAALSAIGCGRREIMRLWRIYRQKRQLNRENGHNLLLRAFRKAAWINRRVQQKIAAHKEGYGL